MDAKPQRPIRALRIHDENAVPVSTLTAGKSIHQRNKSTPALSTLMQVGAVRGAVKRAPFADVSNTSRQQPAKDDSAINGKTYEKAPQVHVEDLQKPVIVAKPFQRPLAVKSQAQQQLQPTVIAIKPTVSSITLPQVQPAIARPLQSQASNSVLRNAIIEPISTVNTLTTSSILEKSTEHVQPQVKVQEKPAAIVPSNAHLADLQVVLEEAVNRTGSVQPIGAASVAQEDTAEEKFVQALEQQAQVWEADRNVAMPGYVQSLKQETMFDDEYEEEEFYSDEAYTTGGRTKAENTTNGATIVLCPRYTNKVMKEINEAREIVESSRAPEEIEDDLWDTSMVAEYGEEIFEYMRTLEERMRPNPHYMDHQNECQWSMRAVLMDWLVQVHHRFGLLPETLFLAVNYIDRFLSCKIVSLGKLQLVGATAIFLAAKYEEVNCPSIQEIVYMVDNGYTQDEVLKAERFMLSMLSFELGWPGPMSFLRRISKADDYDLETRTLAKYFLEVTIMDERFVGCTPSFLSAGAHCLARLLLRKGDWTPAHVHYSNYTYSQLRHLLAVMVECCEEPGKHHAAVFDKYTDRRYKRASLFVQGEIKKGFRLPVFKTRSSFGYRDEIPAWCIS